MGFVIGLEFIKGVQVRRCGALRVLRLDSNLLGHLADQLMLPEKKYVLKAYCFSWEG